MMARRVVAGLWLDTDAKQDGPLAAEHSGGKGQNGWPMYYYVSEYDVCRQLIVLSC